MNLKLVVKDKTTSGQSIKIAPFRQHLRKTSPHKHHSYIELIFLTKGKGFHTIDSHQYDIQTPIVFIVKQDQIHFWDIRNKPEGFVLIIKKQFIENCIDKDIKQLISKISFYKSFRPELTPLNSMFELLNNEFQNHQYKNPLIIDGLLKATLSTIAQFATLDKHVSSNTPRIFDRLIELLETENNLTHKVANYAEKLAITPQKLNTICRKEVQDSASSFIAKHLINEAKRLLIYTDLSINEIGYKLDFNDNSHFIKYFKRHTSFTPNGFRKNGI